MALRWLQCKTLFSKISSIKCHGVPHCRILRHVSASSASSTSAIHVTTVNNGTTNGAEAVTLGDHGHPAVDLTFSSCKEAYRSKTTQELLRAYFVFQICSIPIVVNNNKTVSTAVLLHCFVASLRSKTLQYVTINIQYQFWNL